MNRFRFVVCILLLIPFGVFAQQTALVQATSGRVEIQSRAGGAWTAVSVGDALPIGATISVGLRSSASVQIGSATVQVQSLTRMRLDELAQRDGVVNTELYLPVGRVRAEVQSQQGLQQEFRLRSPVSTAAVRGTSFDFDGQNLEVLTGVVAVANNDGQSTDVAQGESTTVTENEPPPTPQQQLEQQVVVQTSTNPGGGGILVEPSGPTTGSVRLILNYGVQPN
ncbi:MAG: hypothetical protein GW949_10265 [Spirochaetales bacterium]|nr:hypothetical protein [Spirochaetales bacterium]